ncbi:sulfurtransferase DndC [Rhodococcus sp. 05-2256-B2]|uniref:DNA phosphorothioation system sulfurtransferase DndC n=1 Tax=unclassified Rhodococcus (in: high G+C Gram-positive bacteria) TaxID=192944 RepID=UPI000ACFE38E|nr:MULTISPECIES: DNA phosphorothioation system sulfurtransferase DndC [unclassified Rhodococcus (in: high G+C Gram-positive bacteria)]OZD87673.1 sulfurtransferase DndC [Rhodococcus sp. 05-2256-B4]OZD89938.1 sulfurtransferase DndC [Rhodococcus sp. 05-2256-B2]OZD92256.1 sulfurtransferase DndC [Rhodococcus sp. 05-2256-B3]OZD98961.1 sulfurtransferase DndC [Rhodococcus sp. 05-2256-B1]
MTINLPIRPRSAFDNLGLSGTIDELVEQTQTLYLEDGIPWVIGYSGGKDSTAVLQLVWMAIARLEPEKRTKQIHVISTDTLVENPIVAAWVTHSLETIRAAATQQDLPIEPHRLTPAVADTFWVNLAGRGYPAPRPKFRWCTERLKIKPSNSFIINMVKSHGEAILVLGTRKAESSGRSHRMSELESRRVRDLLSPNDSLPNCLVYSPVENWSNDDVWTFLMQTKNPWGYSNKELLTMYQGASSDGECPLVVDSSTPSCGDSRFGCWTCTLVDKDKSMSAMIQNDEEKEWMLPLLELRNELDVADDRHLRDFRRMNGSVQLFHDRTIPGPYTQKSRERWVRKLLEAQTWIRANGPKIVENLELVTLPELEEIRRLWVVEKHEFEDNLPAIYREVTGEDFPGRPLDEHLPLGPETVAILQEVVGDDRLHFELVRELLDIEQRHRSQARRAGLFDSLTKAMRRGFYDDEDDALNRANKRRDAIERESDSDTPSDLDIAAGYVRAVPTGATD